MKQLFIFIILLSTLISCKKKEGDYIVEGRIINAGSNEPIDSVYIILRGGYPYNPGPIMDGGNNDTPNNNYASTYTDKNGYFKLKIEDEFSAYISWYKKGYNQGIAMKNGTELYNNNDVVSISPFGKHYITIKYEAECSFNPIFKKIDTNQDNDTLLVYLNTDYDISPRDFPLAYAEKYTGISPFTFLNTRAYYFTGDTYIYYKFKYTDNGIWKTKIDSVYIKSFETYTDTIYY